MHERDILLAALELVRPEEREAYLAQACGEDHQLRRRVDALLRASDVQDSFLEHPAVETEVLSREIDAIRQEVSEHAEPSLDYLHPTDDPSALGRLGQYTVTDVIGHGGMGVVLRARDTKLNRVVAIKVLAPELASNPTARKRFQREAHAAAAVVHQHVVTIHAVDEDRLPYLVMECIDGQSLKEKIDREGHLKLIEILRIGQQVASGLAAAHAHGLIHRDVKPANILLENGVERVRITDFGLARAVDDVGMTRTGEIAGTPQYMSPEQAQGLPMDGRSDLFSFGCVLYAMCTGRPPFRAETAFATARRVCEDTPRPVREVNPEIPQWLAHIIDRLLAKKPDERYQTAAEVTDLLGQHLAELQHPALPAAPAATASNSAIGNPYSAFAKRPWVIAAAAVALVLLLGISLTEATGVTQVVPTVIRIVTGEGTLVIRTDPAVQVTVEGNNLVFRLGGGQTIQVPTGPYRVRATKDGKPISLERDLITIERGGEQVVRVRLEPATSSARAVEKSERGAFVVLGAKNAEVRKFDTLAEAVVSASDGDTIEIRGNGPFDMPPLDVGKKALIIRAGPEFWPVLRLDSKNLKRLKALLTNNAPLTLEGIELQRFNSSEDGLEIGPVLQVVGPLRMANTRVVHTGLREGITILSQGSGSEVVNSHLLGLWPPMTTWPDQSDFSLSVRNSVLGGHLHMDRQNTVGRATLTFRNNTSMTLLEYRNEATVVKADSREPLLTVEASGNVLAGPPIVAVILRNASDTFTAEEAKAIVRKQLAWKDDNNLYPAKNLLGWHAKDRFVNLLETPEEWRKFWNLTSPPSLQGEPVFEGGYLAQLRDLEKAKAIVPAAFRLAKHSPGKAAGPGGKDLGADVDLVGPGPAYERWKKTPEYQQWLKDTGQLRAEVPKPEPEPGAFVRLGAKGVAERKFDTLAEAVLGSSKGDTIEVRGNGPFVSDGVTTRHPLVIRAGAGFAPSITLSKASADKNFPLITAIDALTLEGLELRREGGADRPVEDRFPSMLFAWEGGSLHVSNCRLICKADSPDCEQGHIFASHAKSLSVQNSILSINIANECGWFCQSGGRYGIENCVCAIGGVDFALRDSEVRDVLVSIRNNTFVGNCLNLTLFSKPNLPAAGNNAPPIRLECSRNVASWDASTRNQCFLFYHQAFPEPLSADQAEALLPRLIALGEKRNVYQHYPPLLDVVANWNSLLLKRDRDLAGWDRLWGQNDTGSVEGDIRFQGGDLVTRARTAPELITAADFRLREDSAGYRADKDGKDLGADVDLVGPGAAYERWKKKPEFQEWLNKTGQKK